MLEVLLCTPLTVEEILRGQWLALRRRFLVPTVGMGMATTLPWIFLSGRGPGNRFPAGIFVEAVSLYGIPKLVCDLLAAGWVGMLVGLTAKRPSLAPGLTVLYTVVLPVAAFCVPDVVISLPLFLWARDKLHRELRAVGSAGYPPVAPLYAQRRMIAKPPPLLER